MSESMLLTVMSCGAAVTAAWLMPPMSTSPVLANT
jgi:hypothetical protein